MGIESTLDTPLARAVRSTKSQSAFGRVINRSQSYVHSLLRDGKELPAKEALLAEEATGVSRFDLCPSIFKRDDASAPAPAHSVRSPATGLEPAR